MKKKKALALILALIMLFSLSSTALAAGFEDFTDVSGHWAEETLKKAHGDALLEGFEDGTLKPDSPITLSQMLTLITRVLNATEMVSLESLGDEGGKWYSEAVAKALYLGIVEKGTTFFDGETTRQNAMTVIARAFSLIPAQPDLSVLSAFTDFSSILEPNKAPMAALVALGLVEGDSNSLNVNGSITRAEFITILYRIVQNYVEPSQFNASLTGGSLIKGSGSLYGISSTENLWFDCKSETVSLSAVSANTLTLRSHKLTSLSLGGGSVLSRLVIDSGNYNISLPTGTGATIGTIQLAGTGTATIGDNGTQNIEVTGSGITLKLSGSHENLIISGSGNTLELSPDAKITNLTISGSDNKLNMAAGTSSCKTINISGTKNSAVLTVSDSAENLALTGSGNTLEFHSSGSLGEARVDGNGNWLSLNCQETASINLIGSYNSIHSNGNVPSLILAGENNAFTSGKENRLGNAEIRGKSSKLIVDGTASHILVTGGGSEVSGAGLADLITVKTSTGKISLKATTLDNNYLTDADRVLKLVTTGYKGDYTLKYAQEHDYADFEKEIFVNAKGYSSKTEYLIWISIATQRTSIFTGSKGDWKLIRSSIVATGAPSSPTPVGVWFTTYKQEHGWTTSTYTCRPVVRFRPNTGYAFHSRLYYPNSNKLTDASIGFPVSQGCIRMYDEDINYIFDNIPSSTTVVVF